MQRTGSAKVRLTGAMLRMSTYDETFLAIRADVLFMNGSWSY